MKRIEEISLWIRIPVVIVLMAGMMWASFKIRVLEYRFLRWYTADAEQ